MTADALLFLSRHCPHCPAVLAGLSDLVKHGGIGRLEVVNIEIHPEAAESYGVRSVPWLRLGPFELAGARTAGELAIWARRASEPDGMAEAFHDLLKTGGLAQVLTLVAADTTRLAALLPIVGNPEASINVRLGAGVVFEEYVGSDALQRLIPTLGELSAHAVRGCVPMPATVLALAAARRRGRGWRCGCGMRTRTCVRLRGRGWNNRSRQ